MARGVCCVVSETDATTAQCPNAHALSPCSSCAASTQENCVVLDSFDRSVCPSSQFRGGPESPYQLGSASMAHSTPGCTNAVMPSSQELCSQNLAKTKDIEGRLQMSEGSHVAGDLEMADGVEIAETKASCTGWLAFLYAAHQACTPPQLVSSASFFKIK